MKKDELITITLTPLEAAKIQACILLTICNDEKQNLINLNENYYDCELNEKINFYRSLAKKFNP